MTQDRTITSPLAHDRLERQLGLSAQLLAQGVQLGDIHLRQHEKARLSDMNLLNAYHHADVSVRRAKTYTVGGPIASQDFARGPAFQRMVERRRAAGILKPEVPHKVRFAWRSLAMGDLNAVDFMTTGHLNLLRRHGAAREIMRYRSPVPKVPFKEGVIVDD